MIRHDCGANVLNVRSQWTMGVAIVIAIAWLFGGPAAKAMEHAAQPAELASDARPEPRAEGDGGLRRSYGAERMDRLDRGRIVEAVLVVAVGAAAAVVGVVMGGLTFAIAAGAAGVYVVLSLP